MFLSFESVDNQEALFFAECDETFTPVVCCAEFHGDSCVFVVRGHRNGAFLRHTGVRVSDYDLWDVVVLVEKRVNDVVIHFVSAFGVWFDVYSRDDGGFALNGDFNSEVATAFPEASRVEGCDFVADENRDVFMVDVDEVAEFMVMSASVE